MTGAEAGAVTESDRGAGRDADVATGRGTAGLVAARVLSANPSSVNAAVPTRSVSGMLAKRLGETVRNTVGDTQESGAA